MENNLTEARLSKIRNGFTVYFGAPICDTYHTNTLEEATNLIELMFTTGKSE
jgi:hypothetical protein